MKEYKYNYKTPDTFDDIILTSGGISLTGLYFANSNDETKHWKEYEIKNLPIFEEITKWLDAYFSGNIPDFTPPIKINDLTPFRENAIKRMNNIPYGKVVTYSDIAKGSLTGYGGGIKNKIALLKLEKQDINNFKIQKKGTKLWKDASGAT